MRRLWLSLITVAVLAAASGAATPPTLTAALDTARVRLGDPLRLRLRVARDADSRTLFPDLGESLGDLRVRAVSPVTTGAGPDTSRVVDERVYELAAFELDVDAVPEVEVAVVAAAGDTLRLTSTSLPFEIVPVRAGDGDDELRDIKPPLDIPGGVPLWLVAAVAALLAVGLAFLARALWLRRGAPETAAPRTPAAPVDYEREFARIAAMGLLERGGLKLYYTRLAEVMRRFLEDVVGIDALERTTQEIAVDLRRRAASAPPADAGGLDDGLAERIVAFLEAADLVKFARAEPPAAEAGAAPDEGRAIVAAVLAARRAVAAQGPDASPEPSSEPSATSRVAPPGIDAPPATRVEAPPATGAAAAPPARD